MRDRTRSVRSRIAADGTVVSCTASIASCTASCRLPYLSVSSRQHASARAGRCARVWSAATESNQQQLLQQRNIDLLAVLALHEGVRGKPKPVGKAALLARLLELAAGAPAEPVPLIQTVQAPPMQTVQGVLM